MCAHIHSTLICTRHNTSSTKTDDQPGSECTTLNVTSFFPRRGGTGGLPLGSSQLRLCFFCFLFSFSALHEHTWSTGPDQQPLAIHTAAPGRTGESRNLKGSKDLVPLHESSRFRALRENTPWGVPPVLLRGMLDSAAVAAAVRGRVEGAAHVRFGLKRPMIRRRVVL